MSPDFDFSAFTAAVEKTAGRLLGEGRPEENLALAARAVQEMAETVLAQNRRNEGHIACGPGCGHCCVVNVAVLQPEAMVIADYLRRKLSIQKLERLKEKIEGIHRRVRWLDDDERLLLRQPCAFLDGQKSCSIHPVRPLLCRGMNSTDPVTCSDAVTLHALDEAPPVLVNLFQKTLFDQAFLGLARALKRTGGMVRSQKLTEAVHAALETPPTGHRNDRCDKMKLEERVL